MNENLIKEGRAYARRHETTLNQLIRDLLSQKVASPKKKSFKDLFELLDKNPSPVKNYQYCREDAYDI